MHTKHIVLTLSIFFPVLAIAQTVTLQNHGNSWMAGFETNCNLNPCPNPETITIPGGNPSNSFAVSAVNDLVVIFVFCFDSCNVSDLSINTNPPMSIATGEIVQTPVQGVQDDNVGQMRLYYIPAAPAKLVGSSYTLSLTITGGVPSSSRGENVVLYQLGYMDFSGGSGYHFVHHLDSQYFSGQCGSDPCTVTTPNITAPGDLVLAWVSPSGHTNCCSSAPWNQIQWQPDGFYATTNSIMGFAYIPSGPVNQINTSFPIQYYYDYWGVLITTFTPTANAPTPNPPTKLVATVQ